MSVSPDYDDFDSDEPIGRGVLAVWKWMRDSGEGDPDTIRRQERHGADIHEAPVTARITYEGSQDWVDRAWAASVAEPTFTHSGEMQVAGDDFAGLYLPDGIVVEPFSDSTLSVIYWPREQAAALRAEFTAQIVRGESVVTEPPPWRSFGYPDPPEGES